MNVLLLCIVAMAMVGLFTEWASGCCCQRHQSFLFAFYIQTRPENLWNTHQIAPNRYLMTSNELTNRTIRKHKMKKKIHLLIVSSNGFYRSPNVISSPLTAHHHPPDFLSLSFSVSPCLCHHFHLSISIVLYIFWSKQLLRFNDRLGCTTSPFRTIFI